jgi:putative transposase
MVNKGSKVSVLKQCSLLDVNRSNIYYQTKINEKIKDESMIKNKIEELYRQNPIYGYRRIHACVQRTGEQVNGKRVLRLMRLMGLRAIYPGPKTTIAARGGDKRSYLLRDIKICRPHQAWQTDITYLRTNHGFMYLTSLIDCYSRYVVGWNLSNCMDQESIMRALEHSLDNFPAPGIINADQGSQFTSSDWINTLEHKGIKVSHSGAGRSNDNAYIERLWRTLKYEWLILRNTKGVSEYKKDLPKFIGWYNSFRPHQALGYKTPAELVGPKDKACGYMDNANAITHIPTCSSSTFL